MTTSRCSVVIPVNEGYPQILKERKLPESNENNNNKVRSFLLPQHTTMTTTAAPTATATITIPEYEDLPDPCNTAMTLYDMFGNDL